MIEMYHDMLRREGNRSAFVKRHTLGFDADVARANEYVKLRENLKAPTLIMWGREDLWLDISTGYR
jgi:pimeloyl-ACP methyl ester carboxylesterase